MRLTSITALVIASLASTSFSFSTHAATKSKKAERWFEVEVILFNQLGDKNLLKEQFPSAEQVVPMPKYKKVVDLFTPYIQPDISALKQLIPACSDNVFAADFVTQNAKLPEFFRQKTLAEIDLQTESQHEQVSNLESANSFGDGTSLNGSDFSGSAISKETELTQQSNTTSDTLSEFGSNTTQNAEEATSLSINVVEYEPLSVQEIALVAQAEAEFSPYQFFTYTPTSTAGNETLCRIEQSAFESYQVLYPDFQYNGFALAKMPAVIDNAEDVYSSSPYLLSKDSLELGDIIKQIRHSKNFQPLMHFGWRLAPKGRNKAEAYRVFSGDNFALHYKNKLDQYLTVEAEKAEALREQAEQDSALDGLMQQLAVNGESTENAINTVLSAEQQQQAQEKQALNAIAEQLLSIDEQTLRNSPELLAENNQINQKEAVNTPPVPFAQPWFLDGLFRVHLNHYLYITADFTVMNHKLDKVITSELAASTSANQSSELDLKPIRFQQNRRVISGEIHYFDHPYIGMLVQIRRHKRPEPPQEDAELSE